MLLAGDDNDAKLLVAHLANDMGFAPVDAGGLVEGGRGFQVGGPLSKFKTASVLSRSQSATRVARSPVCTRHSAA